MKVSSFLALALALALLAIVTPSRAQPIGYGHTIGDSEWQSGTAIDADAAGNVYVLGQTATGNGSDANLLIAKFDPTGLGIWQWQLNFSVMVTPIDLVTDASGDAFFDAVATPPSGPQYGILGRLSPDGSPGFLEQFPMTPNGLAWNAATSNVIVTGDGAGGYGNGFVASFSSAGALRWMRSASVVQSASAWGVGVSDAGNVYVTVDRVAANVPAIAAFSGSGTPIAQRLFSRSGSFGYTWDVAVSPSGNVTFLGYDSGVNLPLIAGFNATLGPAWSEYVNATYLYENLDRIAAHPDGTFYAVGSYFNYSSYDYGSSILHVAGNGSLISGNTYHVSGSAGSYQFVDAAIQTDGSVLLCGESEGSPPRDDQKQGAVVLWPSSGSWVPDNVTWNTNTTVPGSVAVSLWNPRFPVDDFSLDESSQLWWGAVGVPAGTLNVQVSAAAPPPASLNRTVNFTSTVSGGSSPYSYRWSFGDGTFSTAADPVHTYAVGGVYPVQLWVNDTSGNRGYNFTQVTLFAPPSITTFYAQPSVTYVYNYISFYASAVDPNGGYITDFHWDFGDNTSTDTGYGSAWHWYTQVGTYTVNLTVTESEGLNASESIVVQILDLPPNPCLQVYPNPAFTGSNVSFYSCSWDPDGYIASTLWDFGDGSPPFAGSGGTHVYSQPGTYLVHLQVTDNAGLTANATQYESVYVNQPPIANFTFLVLAPGNGSSTVPGPNQTIQFDGTHSYARNVGASLVFWSWDFGDGTSQTQYYYYGFAYHTYSVAGRSYRVTLTVTDSYGVTNTTARSIYVDIPPVAAISAPRSFAKVGTPFVVNGSASTDADGRVRRWLWDFGDGGAGSGAVASHVYTTTGVYTVRLQVFDNNNLTATAQLSVSVVEPKSPTAILSFSPSRPFVGAPVSFDATRSIDPDGAIANYTWQLGDGTVGNGAVLTHAFSEPGVYNVVLTVVDEDSITSSSTATIEVVSRPVASFVVFPTSPQVGDAVSFSAQGSSDLSGILTYTWSFGDGSYGTGWQASHAYTQPGSYQVVLTVTNGYGISTNTTETVVVAPAGLGASAVSVVAWIALGLAVGAGVVALAFVLLTRRRKGGGTPPPSP